MGDADVVEELQDAYGAIQVDSHGLSRQHTCYQRPKTHPSLGHGTLRLTSMLNSHNQIRRTA